MTVLPSALDVQDENLRHALGDLHTCMPGEVVAVRSGTRDARQFVDVLPMLQRAVTDADGEPLNEALPVLQMVPVGYMRGGGFFLSVPLRIGDIVLLVFAERSLDAWIETAIAGAHSPVVPGDLAMHTLQGAIALPLGPAPRSALLTGVDGADMVLGTSSGTVLARFRPDGSVVLAEGTQYVALANLVGAEFERIKSDLATLKSAVSEGLFAVGIGSAASGTTGQGKFNEAAAAVPSTPDSVAATKTKAT